MVPPEARAALRSLRGMYILRGKMLNTLKTSTPASKEKVLSGVKDRLSWGPS